jgi:hypothetical protein
MVEKVVMPAEASIGLFSVATRTCPSARLTKRCRLKSRS